MDKQQTLVELIEEVHRHPNGVDEHALLAILERMDPKIQQALYQTSPSRRKDLEQELRIKVMTCVREYQWKEVPSIETFINDYL